MNRMWRACSLILLGITFAAVGEETGYLARVWQFRLPDRGTACSPALAADGTIYEGTFDGWLVAVTPEGKLKWKFKAGREIKSSPAVAPDGTVYFGSRDRSFYALTADGKLKWSFPTGAWVDSSPAIGVDGTIYFGSWDTNFYALSPTGNLKWKFPTGGIISSSPAIARDGTIYFGSEDKNLYALKSDGTLKWKFTTGAQVISSPAIGETGTIYFSSTDGYIYALNPDGTLLWQLPTGSFTSSSPVLDEAGNLLCGGNKSRYSISNAGKLRWQIGGNLPNSSSAIMLANGLVFTTGPASLSGLFREDSQVIWSYNVGYGFYSSPVISPQGVIYQTDEASIYALKAATNTLSLAPSSWPMWRANPQHTGRVP